MPIRLPAPVFASTQVAQAQVLVSKSAGKRIAIGEIEGGKWAKRYGNLVIKKTADRDEIFVTYC